MPKAKTAKEKPKKITGFGLYDVCLERLLSVRECNSGTDITTYDGPVFWDDVKSAEIAIGEYGGLQEDERLVKVTITVGKQIKTTQRGINPPSLTATYDCGISDTLT